jgi:hypothetical protein
MIVLVPSHHLMAGFGLFSIWKRGEDFFSWKRGEELLG